jgi:uncharacterized protein (UPF0335 family)
MSNINGNQLKALVERIETVEQSIKDEQESRKEIYDEAKSLGFDAAIIRKIVRARKAPPAKRSEEEEIFALYAEACGLQLRFSL